MKNLSQILIVLSIEINCALLFSGEISVVEKVKLEESEVIFSLDAPQSCKALCCLSKRCGRDKFNPLW